MDFFIYTHIIFFGLKHNIQYTVLRCVIVWEFMMKEGGDVCNKN